MSGEAPLTDAEHEALRLTKDLANAMWRVIMAPSGLRATDDSGDWGQFTHHLHAIQHMVMAQAAARAYPDRYRLLGQGRNDQ